MATAFLQRGIQILEEPKRRTLIQESKEKAMKLEFIDKLLEQLLSLNDFSDQVKEDVTELREGLMQSSLSFQQFLGLVLEMLGQDLSPTSLHEATVMYHGVQIGHYIIFAEGEEQVRDELKKMCGDDVEVESCPIECGPEPYKIGAIQ